MATTMVDQLYFYNLEPTVDLISPYVGSIFHKTDPVQFTFCGSVGVASAFCRHTHSSCMQMTGCRR